MADICEEFLGNCYAQFVMDCSVMGPYFDTTVPYVGLHVWFFAFRHRQHWSGLTLSNIGHGEYLYRIFRKLICPICDGLWRQGTILRYGGAICRPICRIFGFPPSTTMIWALSWSEVGVSFKWLCFGLVGMSTMVMFCVSRDVCSCRRNIHSMC